MEKKEVVVCGATGNQGGAVLRHALKRPDWNIIALTRDTDNAIARSIEAQGAMVRKADLEDRDSLISAIRGAQYVFTLTQPWSPDYRKCYPDREIEQGKNIADACRETGIEYLVMSSAAHLEEGRTGIPHVDSKLDVEEYVQDSGLAHTFLRPAQFMDNVGQPFFPVKKGSIRGFVDGEVRVPYVAVNDIGFFAALAMDDPEKFKNQGLNLVGDFVSGIELCRIMSRIRGGEKFRYKSIPKILMRIFAKEFYIMRMAFEEFGRPPYREDVNGLIEDCRDLHPDLMTMEQLLISKEFDKAVL